MGKEHAEDGDEKEVGKTEGENVIIVISFAATKI